MRATALLPPAFALPHSPAVAVLLILLVLGVTYALLNLVVRVGQPAAEEVEAVEGEAAEEPPAPYAEAEAAPGPEPEPAPEAPRPPAPVLDIEAIRVRGVPLALGDTASQVMRAFRPGEGERMPLIERRPDGQAARVVRAYRAGNRLVVLALERHEGGEPLRLTALEIEES